MQKELRHVVAQELRAAGSDAAPKIEGYAATFGTVANIGSFSEVIQKGAFTNTLASDTDVVCLFNHRDELLLGRKSAGTLTLSQDAKGLRFSVSLPDTSTARDCYANLKAGNLKECSFGFFVASPEGERWEKLPDGSMLRTLLDVTLFDVSVVVNPAYSGTSAIARNVVSADAEKRAAMDTANAGALIPTGGPVSFHEHSEKRDDTWDEGDAINGIVNWAMDDEDRASGTKMNLAKFSQGFAYVANDGSNVADYLLPHHTVSDDGELQHQFTGSLRALGKLASGKSGVPAKHYDEVRSHLLDELQLFNDDPDEEDSQTEDMERSAARVRVAIAKLTL
jgi:HK97 family phage prohead protease